MIQAIVLIVVSFLFMEGVAWFTHKYVMHGWLWRWHESHHLPHKSALEKNDLFAIVFSLPAMACIVVGSVYPTVGFLKWIGIGITCYGLFYFVFHDVIVHRRLNVKFIARSKYLKRIIRAHKIHHKSLGKENGEAFGFLYAPKKYEAE